MTALSEAAEGEVFPSRSVALASVSACGGDLAVWTRRWHRIAAELAAEADGIRAALPGSGPGAVPGGRHAGLEALPPPNGQPGTGEC